jgi:hypothetical protein
MGRQASEAEKGAMRAYYRRNREAILARVKANYDPEYKRQSDIWRKYGLTAGEYDRLIALGCVICGGEAKHIDHDHSCCEGAETCGHCVRGALCAGCNVGLGYFKDNPSRLRAAAEYVEAYVCAHELP